MDCCYNRSRGYSLLSTEEDDLKTTYSSQHEESPGWVKCSIFYIIGLGFLASFTDVMLNDVIYLKDPRNLNNTIKHSRMKRFVYMSEDRQLNFPPGTIVDLQSTMSLPGFNPMPPGLGSETAVSIPFDIDLDTLNLTSKDNTFGTLPHLTELNNWIRNWTAVINTSPKTENGPRQSFLHAVREILSSMGVDGKECSLRLLCEVHDLQGYGMGFVGEVLETLLTISSSTEYFEFTKEYLEAEKHGKSDNGCEPYEEKCPMSFIRPFTKEQENKEDEIRHNFLKKHPEHSNEFNSLGHYKLRKKIAMKFRKKPKKRLMKVLSRKKRQIFFGPAGRFMMPPGSIYIIKPQLKLPYMRDLPKGYGSGMAIGIPMRFIYDDLGITSALNPFLNIGFLSNLFGKRRKRDTWQPIPGVNYAFGDREHLYEVLVQTMDYWNYNGHECMLKAICETHLSPLHNYSVFGEILTRFLSPSKAPYAELRLPEYLEAEKYGKKLKYCSHYEEKCPLSLFTTKEELDRKKDLENSKLENEITSAELPNKIKRSFMM